jgi:ferredoxin
MSAIIYYFSGTGNSLVAAKDLAAELGGAQVIPIVKVWKSGAEAAYDIVGIVYPVYMFGVPLIIANFLKNVKIKKGAYVFCVATCGGLPGRAHSLSRDILKRRGIEMAAGFSVLMPGNYTPLYGAIPDDKQADMFRREKARMKQIALFVREGKSGIFEEKPFLVNLLLYKALYKGGTSLIPMAGKNFWITDSCTKCGLCAKVCPVENIAMNDGKPVWLEHCQCCMACLQWCPVEAIQYKKSTQNKKRYHHPDVTAQAITEQR